MKPADVVEQMKTLDSDKEILCQVVDQEGNAWNMHFDFLKPTGCSFNVLDVHHPDLKDFYHIRPNIMYWGECGNKLLEKIIDVLLLTKAEIEIKVAEGSETYHVCIYNKKLQFLSIVVRKTDNAFIMMPMGTILHEVSGSWKTSVDFQTLAELIDFVNCH